MAHTLRPAMELLPVFRSRCPSPSRFPLPLPIAIAIAIASECECQNHPFRDLDGLFHRLGDPHHPLNLDLGPPLEGRLVLLLGHWQS